MAWGEGECEGNEERSCLRAPHPPRPFTLGRQASLCYRQHRDVDRFECSSGSVRSLKATAFFVALRLLTLPGERATPTGHNPSQRRNIGFNEGQTLVNNWGCPSSSGCNPSACMRFGERAMSFSRKGTRGTFLSRATSL